MSCKSEITHTKIVLQDGLSKSKICFVNSKNESITKIVVDNCLIKSGKRCDFMLIDHNGVEYFIELKGKEVVYACCQIEETIKQISKNDVKHSFVISSACPITTTQVQVLKATFKKKYNSSLTVKNKFCEQAIT